MRVVSRSVLGLSVVVLGCGVPDPSSVTRVDSAGVEVVTSTLDDRTLAWTFEREFVRGGADEGPEAFYRIAPNLVDADAHGRLYVLDAAQSRIVVFGPDGGVLLLLGGPGEGPGEIVAPGSLVVSPEGVARVFDYGKGALVGFDATGAPLPAHPFLVYPRPTGGRHLGASVEGLYAAAMLPRDEADGSGYVLQLHQGSDTVQLTDVRFPSPAMARGCGGGLQLPRVFEADLVWDNHGPIVAAAAGPAYRVTLFDGALAFRVLRVDRPTRAATEEMAIAQLREGVRVNFGGGLCVISPEVMVPQRGFAEVLPWIDDIAVSPSGEVWVRRFEVGPDIEGPIDVFDATGAYLGTAPPDTPFPLAFLDGDRFAAVEIDATDVERVAVFRIHRAGG